MIVHLNGELVPLERAKISPLDRGFILGEGVYEGLRAVAWNSSRGARVLGIDLHRARLQRSVEAAGLEFDASPLGEMSLDLLAANGLNEAFVYWQITGGTPRVTDAPRSRVAPRGLKATVFGYCAAHPAIATLREPAEKRVIVTRDPRWMIGWLKSTSLMGNVLAARQAAQTGCEEAILIRGGDEQGRGGVVSEGLATNVVMVMNRGGKVEIATPSLESAPMLRGVTRDILLAISPEIVERRIERAELDDACEVMLIGTTTYVASVVEMNGQHVGDGRPGAVARELFTRLMGCYARGEDMTLAERVASVRAY